MPNLLKSKYVCSVRTVVPLLQKAGVRQSIPGFGWLVSVVNRRKHCVVTARKSPGAGALSSRLKPGP